MPVMKTQGFAWLAWAGLLLSTGCTIEVSPNDGGGSSNTTPPTVITVRIVNATGKALDPQIYGIAYVPFRANLWDGLAIAGVALAISLAATLYPARRATRVHPVEVLRYE